MAEFTNPLRGPRRIDPQTGASTLVGPTAEDMYEAQGPQSFERGLRSAATSVSAGAFANDALQAELAGDTARMNALRANASVLANEAEMQAPKTRSLADINSVDTALDWAAGSLGQGVATMAPVLAGAAAGRFGLRGPGAFAGAYGAGYGMEKGEAVLNQMADPAAMAQSPQLRDRTAMAKGGVNAALESIVPMALTRPGRANLFRNARDEALTEMAQQRSGQLAQQFLNPERDRSGDLMELIDAGAAGGLTGGALSLPKLAIDLGEKGLGGLDAMGAMAKSGAMRARDLLSRPRTDTDKAADELQLGDASPGLYDEDLGKRMENLKFGDVRRPETAKQVADVLLGEQDVSETTKQKIRDMGGDYTSMENQMFLGGALAGTKASRGIAKGLDGMKRVLNDVVLPGAAVAKEKLGEAHAAGMAAVDGAKRSKQVPQSTQKLERRMYQTILKHSRPEYLSNESVRNAIKNAAGVLARAIANYEHLTDEQIKSMVTLEPLTDNPEAMFDELTKESASAHSLMSDLKELRPARTDATDPKSFLSRNIPPEVAQDLSQDQFRQLGEVIDDFIGRGGSGRKEYSVMTALSQVFGSEQTARDVLDYYGDVHAERNKRRGEKAVPTEGRDAVMESDDLSYEDAEGTNEIGVGADYKFKSAAGEFLEPFTSDKEARDSGRKGAPISLKQAMEETGGDTAGMAGQIRERLTKELGRREKQGTPELLAKLRKRLETAPAEEREALQTRIHYTEELLTDEGRQRTADLKQRQETFNSIDDDTLLASHVVLKDEGLESNPLELSDADLRSMRTLTDAKGSKTDPSVKEKARETLFNVEMKEGRQVKISAESLWKTWAKKQERAGEPRRENEGDTERVKRLFLEGLASLQVHESVGSVQPTNETLIDRELGIRYGDLKVKAKAPSGLTKDQSRQIAQLRELGETDREAAIKELEVMVELSSGPMKKEAERLLQHFKEKQSGPKSTEDEPWVPQDSESMDGKEKGLESVKRRGYTQVERKTRRGSDIHYKIEGAPPPNTDYVEIMIHDTKQSLDAMLDRLYQYDREVYASKNTEHEFEKDTGESVGTVGGVKNQRPGMGKYTPEEIDEAVRQRPFALTKGNSPKREVAAKSPPAPKVPTLPASTKASKTRLIQDQEISDLEHGLKPGFDGRGLKPISAPDKQPEETEHAKSSRGAPGAVMRNAQAPKQDITSFHGDNRFLSNFYPVEVELDGVKYPSVEHAYQAAKTKDPEQRKAFESGSPGDAKRRGRRVTMRPEWNQIKERVMRHLVKQKFSNPDFARRLAATGDAKLIEGNTWGDKTWGAVWNGSEWVGQNILGKMLMELRSAQTKSAESPADAVAPLSADDQAKVIAEIVRQRGKDVKVTFETLIDAKTGDEYSGEYGPGRHIKISLGVGANMFNVARHEALHDLFATLTMDNPAVRKMRAELLAAAESPRMRAQLNALLKDQKGALEQLSDPEERLAYMYQFWADGKLTVGSGTKNWFERIQKFLRDLLGIVSQEEKVEGLLRAFHSGKFAKPSHVGAALQDLHLETLRDKYQRLAPPVADFTRKLLTSATDRLRDTNIPAFIDLADDFYREPGRPGQKGLPFLQGRAQSYAHYTNRLGRILAGASKVEIQEALDGLYSETMPQGARANQIYAQIHELLEELFGYMSTKGVQVSDGVDNGGKPKYRPVRHTKNYFQRVWDSAKIRDRRSDFVATLMAEGGLQLNEAWALYDAMSRGTGALEFAESDHDLGFTPFNRAVKDRKLKFITKANIDKFRPYLEDDLVTSMSTYIAQATHRAEYAERFGNAGERLNQVFDKARTQGASEKDIQEAGKAVRALEGTLGAETSPEMKRLFASLVTYENIVLLPFALFNSLVDPMGIAIRSGKLEDAWSAFTEGISGLVKAVTGNEHDENYDMAQTLGLIDDAHMLQMTGELYHGMYMSKFLKNMNMKFFRLNGMEPWNQRMRVAGMIAGEKFILNHINNPTEHSARYLEELDLTGHKPTMKGDRIDFEKDQRSKDAIYKFVDGAVLRPSAAHRPVWGSDPMWMLVFHLKQFTFSFHNTIIRRVANEMEHGNATPLAMLASYVPFLMGISWTKMALLGNLPEKYDFLSHLNSSIAKSGVLGIGAFGMDAMADAAVNSVPGSSFLGPTAGHGIQAAQTVLGSPTDSAEKLLLRSLPASPLFKAIAT